MRKHLNICSKIEAIAIGIELEASFCQTHIAYSFKFKEEKYRTMFAAMARSDEDHCQKLQELQQTICQS